VFVPRKSLVKVLPTILDIFLGELLIVCMDRGNISLLVVNVTWIDLDSLACWHGLCFCDIRDRDVTAVRY
jgi:hypothetical protein